MYTLQANDGVAITFTSDELSHCKYPSSIYTSICGQWMSAEAPMEIHMMNSIELAFLKEFLELRVRLNESPCIRDIPPRVFNTEIMENGTKSTGYKFVSYPSLIDIESMPIWSPEYTGLHEEYHTFLNQIIGESEATTLFKWILTMDYLGCNDLLYLIQARCAFLYVHLMNEYMIKHTSDIISTYRQKVDAFFNDSRTNSPACEFIQVFTDLKVTHPQLAIKIMTRFVRHRGIDMPRSTWGDEEWAKFYVDAPKFYASLPLSAADKLRLYSK